jgi:mono/diheme cytochrome c family protein
MKKIILLVSVFSLAAAMTACAADGKALWDQHCAMCHGADGKGQTNMGKRLGVKDYTDPKVQAALTDGAATKAIKDGFKSADGKTVMRPAKNLSDDDVKALVTYMRSLKK